MDIETLRQSLAVAHLDSSPDSVHLRQTAHQILANVDENGSNLAEVLLGLLTKVVKPLFTVSKHPALTSTGRKVLVAPPPSVGRFNTNILDEETKPWKNGWTTDLLKYIISNYAKIPIDHRKATIEGQFHLLIPPILNLIDDGDPVYKARGCEVLRLLCNLLIDVKSDMMKRTGLTEVFIDALKPNFLLLPTLTPEDESLMVVRELYPTFLALVDARFIELDRPSDVPVTTTTTSKKPAAGSMAAEQSKREEHLTLLLRHGILASLSHLSAGESTSYLDITTFLVSQISIIVNRMGLPAVVHLQRILPLLRRMLCDPFGAAALDLLSESLTALQIVVRVCEARIKMRWWAECLRGVVGCWCTVIDEEHDQTMSRQNGQGSKIVEIDDGDVQMAGEGKRLRMKQIQDQCQEIVKQLRHVVGEEFAEAEKQLLLEEEEDLKNLFHPHKGHIKPESDAEQGIMCANYIK